MTSTRPGLSAALVFAVSAAAGPAAAQTVAPLTLERAVEMAIATSHRLAELDARREGAAAAVETRRLGDHPTISAQAGYTRTNHVDEFGITMPTGATRIIYPDVPDNARTRIDLQWPIYTFGRFDALERAARAEVRAAQSDIATARRDLGLEVTRAFWAVVTARASVGVLEESLARMDASLTDVRNRFDVGLVPPSDVLSMEAQRARQQMLLIRARNTFEQTLTDLRYLTGQAPGTPIEIQARLEESRPPAPTTGTLLADALTNRPERGAMTARIEGAEERLRAALANRRPVIGLGAGVDYARPNTRIFPRAAEWNPSWDVSVNLTWTLWDGGKVKAETAEVTAAQRAARERLADFDARLAADITRSTLDVDSARAVVVATDEALRAATEARRVVGERFDAGVATSTEVLDAQVALLQAHLDRTQALAAVRLAEARLDWALGR